jgi:hypothetical protein
MTHPSEAELALYAGSDLGWFQRKMADRHIRQCDACQAAVVGFSELRTEGGFPPVEMPALQWNRLSSEMAANIRLGIAAGECVNIRPARVSLVRPRLALALAGLLAVAGAGFLFERSIPGLFPAPPVLGTVLEASENGLVLREGGRIMRLLNTSGKGVSRSVGARGEIGARYLDPNTGYVTISQVYGE